MEQRSEVGQALNKLQAVRQQNSRLALMANRWRCAKVGFSAGCKSASPANRWTPYPRGSLLLECAALTDFGLLRSPASKLLATGGGGLRHFLLHENARNQAGTFIQAITWQ
jgi:hypothetical protein